MDNQFETMKRSSPLTRGMYLYKLLNSVIRVDDVNFKPTLYNPITNKKQIYYICGFIASRSIKYLVYYIL